MLWAAFIAIARSVFANFMVNLIKPNPKFLGHRSPCLLPTLTCTLLWFHSHDLVMLDTWKWSSEDFGDIPKSWKIWCECKVALHQAIWFLCFCYLICQFLNLHLIPHGSWILGVFICWSWNDQRKVHRTFFFCNLFGCSTIWWVFFLNCMFLLIGLSTTLWGLGTDRGVRVHAMRAAICETFPEPNRRLLQR